MTLEPQIQTSNLRDQALNILKSRLISGELTPGEIYSAASLANELGVSNSPVREAMLTLVNQGLMETVRNRGFRVVPVRRKQLEDIYNVRMLLEIPSIHKLAEIPETVRKIEPELRNIIIELRRSSEAKDIVGYLTADKQFHLKLLALLNNPYLVSTVENLRDQVRQYGVSAQAVLARSGVEHEDILAAILEGNPPKAAELMRQHIHQLVDDFSGASDANAAE